ncbi:MAG: hypothetical protein AB2687_19800, partial [Candidatus Thiodiazotropha taylori]
LQVVLGVSLSDSHSLFKKCIRLAEAMNTGINPINSCYWAPLSPAMHMRMAHRSESQDLYQDTWQGYTVPLKPFQGAVVHAGKGR